MASDEFNIREVLYQGRDIHVSRGRRVRDNLAVVIKRCTDSQDSLRRSQLLFEYNILQKLAQSRAQGVPTPIEMLNRADELALVLDDSGGYALRVYQKTQALNLKEILHVGIGVAKSLGGIHRCGVTHKDVNPNNIVFNRHTGAVTLIDFQIASVLQHEEAARDAGSRHAGTLAYMAPEQTGRMNRTLDYRADFYSLGATLYELLSGRLPFGFHDVDQLLNAVLTQPPADLLVTTPECPPVLAHLVDKLMAKPPERRYQSAEGIVADLQRCLDACEQTVSPLAIPPLAIPTFDLGQQDRSTQFTIPQKIYGRGVELAAVEAVYQRAADGHRELLWISGPSGIGKSALVGELQRLLAQHRSLFSRGKCDQFRRHIPFNGLALAMDDLVRQIFMESDSVVTSWRRRLTEAIGTLGRCLTDAAPNLELLLGPQGSLVALGPQETENRLLLAWQRLIGGLCAEQPLVIFLDDLQWADSGTYKLLEALTQQRGDLGAGLLLVSAYRNDELEAGHPLHALFTAMQNGNANVGHLSVSPLPIEAVVELLRDTTRAPLPACQGLAALVLERTGGNPYFVRELVAALHAHDLLSYIPEANSWTWDMAAIRAAPLHGSIDQIISERLAALSVADQNILSFAACLGSQFSLEDLSVVMRVDRSTAAQMLETPLRAGFIVPMQSDYRYAQDSNTDVAYRFAHDQIQSAAYALQSAEQTTRTHYQIGRRLVAKYQGHRADQWVINALGHLNTAVSLVSETKERQELARLNHTGALEARRAVAYGTALEYLETAVALWGGDAAWQSHRDIMWQLSLDMGDCYFLLGNLERANALVEQLAARATSNVERAEVFRRSASSLCATNRYQESVNAGIEALKLLGVTMPRQPSIVNVAAAMVQIRWISRGRRIEEFPLMAPMTEENLMLAMHVLNDISHAAYFANPSVFAMVGLTMTQLTLSHGLSPFSASAFTMMGVSYSLLNKTSVARSYMEAGRTCHERVPGSANGLVGQYLNVAFVDFTRMAPQQAFERYHASTMATLEAGDPLNAWLLAAAEVLCLIMISPERCIERCNLYETTLPFNAVASMAPLLVMARQTARCLLGETLGLHTLQDAKFEEKTMDAYFREPRAVASVGAAHNLRLLRNYLCGDYSAAVSHAHAAMDNHAFSKLVNHDQLFYSFHTLLAITGYQASRNRAFRLRPSDISLWMRARTKLQTVADDGPALFGGTLLLVRAEVAGLQGDVATATRLYEEATQALGRSNYPSLAAMGHECAGRYFLRHDMQTAGTAHLQAAMLAYNTWGATGKSAHLESEFAHHTLAANVSPQGAGGKYRFAGTTTDLLTRSDVDFPAMLKASQSLSSEMVRERLLARLVETVVAQTGATRVTYAVRDGSTYVAECDSVVAVRPLPQGLLNWVGRSQEALTLNSPAQHPDFGRDPYFSTTNVRSLLCVPVAHQGDVIGFIYCETEQVDRPFTVESMVLLRVLSTQLAVALENARIHSALEREVATYKLQLKSAHARIEQHEREAHETQIAGGFAHEMRNALSGARMTLTALYPTDNAVVKGGSCFENNQAHLKELAALHPEDAAQSQILEAMQADQTLSEECYDHLSSVIGRALSLTQQMLDYSHIGTITVGADATPASNLVSRVLSDLQGQLNDRGAQTQFTVEPDLVIPMKEEHAYVILRNLIANAGDALRDRPGERRIMVRAEKSHRGVVLSVEDNGVGMSEQTQADIFRPFFTTKGSHGTGLGLGLSRKLALMYGGELQFRSVQQKGTTFELVLPV